MLRAADSFRPMKLGSRNGLSLPTGGCPFPDHLWRIVVPGLLLQTPGRACCRSVRFRTPLLAPFPEAGRFIVLRPLSALLLCRPGVFPILAPHRDRSPSGSSLVPVCHQEACHCERPISLHSPETSIGYFRLIASSSLRSPDSLFRDRFVDRYQPKLIFTY
jgi:hypothetical protein